MGKILLFFFFVSSLLYAQQYHWQKISSSADQKFCATSSGRLFIAKAGNKYIKYSDNNGATWYQKGITSSFHKFYVDVFDRIWITSIDSLLIMSEDNGESFNTITNKAVVAIGVGHDGTIYLNEWWPSKYCKSTDNGSTWLQLNDPGLSAGTILVTDENTIMMSGNNEISVTTDGGASWNMFETDKVNQVFEYQDNLYFSAGGLHKSTNNGVTWYLLDQHYSRSYYFFADDTTVFAGNYRYYQSDHTFSDWDDLEFLEGSWINDVQFINDKLYVIQFNGIYLYDRNYVTPPDGDYMPLAIGNQWLYKYFDGTTRLITEEIEDTVRIEGKLYYLNNFGERYRYCAETASVYMHNDEVGEYRLRVFNLWNGAEMRGYNHYGNYWQGFIEKTNKIVLGKHHKAYIYNEEVDFEWRDFYYADGVGLYHMDGHIQYGYPKDKKLLEAKIIKSDSTYQFSNAYPAQLNGNFDNTSSDNGEVRFNFIATHPNTISSEFDFIKSVKFISHYSNGSHTTEDNVVEVQRVGTTNSFAYTAVLDTSLTNNGYFLYYKWIVTDNGLFNLITFFPTEGYYGVDAPIGIDVTDIPEDYSLSQNYPNPFNPETTITYSLKDAGNVTITVYNQLGEVVKKLINEYRSAGEHSVRFNGTDLSTGIYYYRISSGGFSETKKMILLK